MTKQQILANLMAVGVVPVVRTATAEVAIRPIKALEQIAARFGDRITLGGHCPRPRDLPHLHALRRGVLRYALAQAQDH